MSLLLALLFAATALLYASVGFGGGSTYNALLVLAETDYRVLPSIALCCNIVVVTGGVWRFARAGHIPWLRVLPLGLLSVPMAWIGGRIVVPETVFIGLLGGSLLLAGLLLLRPVRAPRPLGAAQAARRRRAAWTEPALGAGLGLLSGVVGIGGGIFLAPVLHLFRWGPGRAIAGTAALFILVNSAAGLGGQMTKLSQTGGLSEAFSYWPLLPAVLIGGQIGSHLGARVLPEAVLRRLTALLVLFVALRLLLRFARLLGAG
ncbi:sulfite exporter TauE/SafE family protein [Parvularcula oceani]|uniref:sulfite exporter TauE/SafE family protein n=1 Tax=Parvularcula oceani TaxID=1247963 RepID=UPI0004E1F6F1|nr:sulfite exporter TauE/SafE family protein [Parvularcula oceani]